MIYRNLFRLRLRPYTFLGLFLSVNTINLQANTLKDLTSTSLEDLLRQEVTTVSKKQENLYTAPAAVYVITAEDIRRRGVKNIPEALAIAPGLQVRSIDGNKWSVGSRGFSGVYSNKLLVQIDGRSIYNPTFSGVYWEQHNIPIHEIKRIEVIRGSGATLWGANAVNGVINIITQNASDSQGQYIHVSGGNKDKGSINLRYGDSLNSTSFRVNAQMAELDNNSSLLNNTHANDGAQNKSISFRLDSAEGELHAWGVSGGYHENQQDQTLSVLNIPPPLFSNTNVHDETDTTAYYLKGNYSVQHRSGSNSAFHWFVDNYERSEQYLNQNVTTYELDYQLTLPPLDNHNIILGAGYRKIDAEYDNTYAVSIDTEADDINLYSAYIQDEYTLIQDTLSITFGSKFEHHDFTGREIQPNLRISYTPSHGHFTWAAISKAVRTPSIAERGSLIQGGITQPITTWVQGNNDANSENVTSYEIGYRYFSSNVYTLDLSVFYTEYDNYLSFEQINPITFQMDNKLSGRSYGFELASVWQPTPNWQLIANYSYLDIEMQENSDSTDPLSRMVLNGSYAKNMIKLHSAWDISNRWSFDSWIYYIDKVTIPSNFALFQSLDVDETITTNVRLSWRARSDIELGLTLNNLFDSKTLESIGESLSLPTEIERSATLSVTWSF